MLNCCVIGDSHIPRRAKEVHSKIYEMLKDLTNNGLFNYTFFTGDQIKAPKFMNFLNDNTTNDVFIVIGNMDYFDGNRDAPVYQELKLDTFTIGLTHGAQIQPRGDHLQLTSLAMEKKYNILISGHTHHEEIFLSKKGILLLNPGSVTGAWSFVASGIPSFMRLIIGENLKDIEVILYQLDRKSQEIKATSHLFIFQDGEVQTR